MIHPLFKRLIGTVASLLAAVVLFSLISVVGYWIYAFLYYGGHGDLIGLPEWSVTHVPGLSRFDVSAGTAAHQALRLFGPGVFVLVPSFLLLKLFERIVPR